MAEFCLECWNKLNGAKYTEGDFILAKERTLCEGCGEWKRVIEFPQKPGLFRKLFGFSEFTAPQYAHLFHPSTRPEGSVILDDFQKICYHYPCHQPRRYGEIGRHKGLKIRGFKRICVLKSPCPTRAFYSNSTLQRAHLGAVTS